MRRLLSRHIAVFTVAALLPSTAALALSAPASAAPTLTQPKGEYRGAAALTHLGARISTKARELGLGVSELQEHIRRDRTLFVDEQYNLGYAEPAPAPAELIEAALSPASPLVTTPVPTTPTEAFNLSTNPAAPLKIYLDFDGHTTTGTSWNASYGSSITSAPFDTNSSPTTWSSSELSAIFNVWRIVADDYAPWNVDVTTRDPGVEALRRATSTDANYGIRVVITPSNFYSTSAGGVAYLNSFTSSVDTPAFVFAAQLYNSAKYMGEAASHEVGHTVSLSHDGTSTAAYYQGTATWAPIMGAAYSAAYSTFSNGQYADANNFEDDVAKITGFLPLRADDHGNTTAAATALPGPGTFYGAIGTAADVDAFNLTVTSPAIMTVNGFAVAPAPNLNIGARVYSPSGALVASSQIAGSRLSPLSVDATAGTYTVVVSGEGVDRPDYGSLGEYQLVVALSANQPPTARITATSDSDYAPAAVQFSAAGSTDPEGETLRHQWTFHDGATSTAATATRTYLTPGSYPVDLVVTDPSGETGRATYTVSVLAPPAAPTATLAATPPTGTAPLTVTLSAADSTGAGLATEVVWDLGDGSTPSAGGYTISHVYTAPGTYQVTATVTGLGGEDTATVTVTVDPPAPLVVTAGALPPGTLGTAYRASLTATGAVAPTTWTRSSGVLPPGVALSPGGVLSGTPTATGTFSFTAQTQDGAGRTATGTFTIVVANQLLWQTTSLTPAAAGVAYGSFATLSGGTGPISARVPLASLPPGITMAVTVTSDGRVAFSGTPTTTGTFTFTVTAADAAGRTASYTFTIIVYPPVQMTTTALAAPSLNVAYQAAFAKTGGAAPYSWSVTAGRLPSGLTLSTAGVLSGTPTATGAWTFTIRVSDATGSASSRSFTLTVTTAVAVSATVLPAGTVGTAYSAALQATGGTAPYTWSLAVGAVPPGLTLSSTGTLSGNPTSAGSYTFTVRAADTQGRTATRAFTVVVANRLAVATSTLPPASRNLAYSTSLAATGGNAPYVWARASGTLPSGLTLYSTGVLSGIPSATGTWSFTARVTDAQGRVATRSYTMQVTAMLTITTTSVPSATVGAAYSRTFTASGGVAPYSWSRVTGTLPPGLGLSSGGVLTGIPTVAGSYTFGVQVRDVAGRTATRSFTVNVAAR